MEPITITAMVSGVVGYLANKLENNKSISDFFNDFTDATVNWIRPVFLKDNQNKEVLDNLINNPKDDLNQKDAENAILRQLRQNEDFNDRLKEMHEVIMAKNSSTSGVNVSNSKNVNTGAVNTGGGNFMLGDNNTNSK